MQANDTDLINQIEFVDERERAFFAQAQMGEQVRAFLASPVGRYLHGRAKQDLESVKDELLECDPDSFFGRRKFRRLAKKADVAASFMRYLTDSQTEAELAVHELDNYRNRG